MVKGGGGGGGVGWLNGDGKGREDGDECRIILYCMGWVYRRTAFMAALAIWRLEMGSIWESVFI